MSAWARKVSSTLPTLMIMLRWLEIHAKKKYLDVIKIIINFAYVDEKV